MSIVKRKIVENTVDDTYKTIELASVVSERTLHKTDLSKATLIEIYSLIVKITSLNRDLSIHLAYQNGDKDTLVELQKLINNLRVTLQITLEENLDAQKISKAELLTEDQKQTLNNFVEFSNEIVEKLPTLTYKQQMAQYKELTIKFRSLFEEGVDNAFVEDKYNSTVQEISHELLKLFHYMQKIANDAKIYGIYKALSINKQTSKSLSNNIQLLNDQMRRLKKAGLLKKEIYKQYSCIITTLTHYSFTF